MTFTVEMAEVVRDLSALRSLDLRGCDVTADAFQIAASNLSIQTLAFEPTAELPLDVLGDIPAPERLRSLHFHTRVWLLPKHVGMQLGEWPRPEHDLEVLARFTSLEHLSLWLPGRVRGSQLRHLSNLTKLRDLDLSGERSIEDAHLEWLPSSIERIDLSRTGWSGRLPTAWKRLRVITAEGCANLRNKAIAGLRALTQLQALRLWEMLRVSQRRAAISRTPPPGWLTQWAERWRHTRLSAARSLQIRRKRE